MDNFLKISEGSIKPVLLIEFVCTLKNYRGYFQRKNLDLGAKEKE